MFAFFLLYQRCVNEYMIVLNVACMRRRRRRLRRTRVAPYAWPITRPANSWFDVHCNDPRIPQEYFQQQLGVNKDTFDTVLLRPETGKGKFVFQRLFPTAESSGFGTVSFGPQEFVFNHHCTSVYCAKINCDRGNARHGKCPIWSTLFCGLRVTNNLFLPIASFNIILNNKSSRLRKRLLLLNLIWKIGKPHPSTTAHLIFGRFSRFWESFLSESRTSKIFALTDRHRNVTAKNRYACHDFSAWNKRQQSHYLSQNVEPSRA